MLNYCKGVYPYDYINNPEKFEDTPIPSRKEFYSQFNNKDHFVEDYMHAHNVFKMNNLGDITMISSWNPMYSSEQIFF